MTQEKITIDTLAERVSNYHTDTKADLTEIKRRFKDFKEELKGIKDIATANAARIRVVEVKQGLLTRIIFVVLGGGGLAGAAVGILAKLGLSDGG